MKRGRRLMRTAGAIAVLCVFRASSGVAQDAMRLPPLPPPSDYGNVMIDRASIETGLPPVTFSHWSHRLKYTCRVCHAELEFEMQPNATEITHEKNEAGKFCGACHDGKTAFGHMDASCDRCHNGRSRKADASGVEFARLTRSLPKAPFGNRIDWVLALASSAIKPRPSLRDSAYVPKRIDKTFDMTPEWKLAVPARFSHDTHTPWLDCANCHPDLFAIKRTVTEHVEMTQIVQGKSCGVCHVRVAFPLNDCKRCHPAWVD